eukprot:1172129-Prorocentrum_minimum.AAC.1
MSLIKSGGVGGGERGLVVGLVQAAHQLGEQLVVCDARARAEARLRRQRRPRPIGHPAAHLAPRGQSRRRPLKRTNLVGFTKIGSTYIGLTIL